MERLESVIAVIARLFARLGGAMIVVIAVLVSIDVFTRNFFNVSLLNSLELSVYLFAIAIAFGLSFTALCGAHIRVDVLYVRFPAAMRRALDFLAFASLTGLSIFFFVSALRLMLASLERGATSNSVLAAPLAIPQAFWVAGFFVFALTCSLLTLRHGLLLARGLGAEADRIGRFGAGEEVAEAVDEALGRER